MAKCHKLIYLFWRDGNNIAPYVSVELHIVVTECCVLLLSSASMIYSLLVKCMPTKELDLQSLKNLSTVHTFKSILVSAFFNKGPLNTKAQREDVMELKHFLSIVKCV